MLLSSTPVNIVRATSDGSNVYAYKDGRILSSDIDHELIGTVPFQIVKYKRYFGENYLLDNAGKLMCGDIHLCSNVIDFNAYYVLFANGAILEHNFMSGASKEFRHFASGFEAEKLVNDLLIGKDHCLYGNDGGFITDNVKQAHTDDKEIIIVHHNDTLEYIGDLQAGDEIKTNCDLLSNILAVTGVKKSVVSRGSVLLLSHSGQLIASGANYYFECGFECPNVGWISNFNFPAPVRDFSFRSGIGWAVLEDDSVWVWGKNDRSDIKFLQWADEYCVRPRRLF